jgi:hypothetical protein
MVGDLRKGLQRLEEKIEQIDYRDESREEGDEEGDDRSEKNPVNPLLGIESHLPFEEGKRPIPIVAAPPINQPSSELMNEVDGPLGDSEVADED